MYTPILICMKTNTIKSIRIIVAYDKRIIAFIKMKYMFTRIRYLE